MSAPTKKPKRIREWVPSAFLVVHDENVSTSIRYTPMQMRRNEEAGYFSTVKIYGNNVVKPIWQRESERLSLDAVFAIDSAQIARELGVERLFHYGEAFNWSPDFNPPDPNISMPLHAHYMSRDGSFHGHIASFYIFGAPRRIEKGEFYYETFPAARIDDELYVNVYLINPFVRASAFWVQIVTNSGEIIESEEQLVRGKGVAMWSSKHLRLDPRQNPLAVIVRTEVKTSAFFATLTRDEKMIGLDHGHPFLQQVLNHVNPVTVTAVPVAAK